MSFVVIEGTLTACVSKSKDETHEPDAVRISEIVVDQDRSRQSECKTHVSMGRKESGTEWN